MLTVVLYLLLTLLIILVILVGSLFLPWKFGLTGEIVSTPGEFTGTGSATIGANTCGISVKLQKELVIGIGPYNNPWLKKSIKSNKSKQKTVKDKPSTKKKGKKKAAWRCGPTRLSLAQPPGCATQRVLSQLFVTSLS